MRVVDLSQKVTAQYYDEEFSEWSVRSKTIADVLWDTIDENVDDISFDAVPVRHGRWMHDKDNVVISGYCSICGWTSCIMETDVADMPFCPNCGADMRGKGDAT